ncbi:hypothetical protein KUCAC02_027484, partial [Chaenocephalus aceratus]
AGASHCLKMGTSSNLPRHHYLGTPRELSMLRCDEDVEMWYGIWGASVMTSGHRDATHPIHLYLLLTSPLNCHLTGWSPCMCCPSTVGLCIQYLFMSGCVGGEWVYVSCECNQ